MFDKKLVLRCTLERESDVVCIFETSNNESVRLVYKKSEMFTGFNIGDEYVLSIRPNKDQYTTVVES